ncbi:hypothetical protein E4T47_06992 [Aureobasidium subglaciale]|nr:hypothetical protein E4T47_06992 [Aureobasidium subglaciale]
MLSMLFTVRVSSQSQAEQRAARASMTVEEFCSKLLLSYGVPSLDQRTINAKCQMKDEGPHRFDDVLRVVQPRFERVLRAL